MRRTAATMIALTLGCVPAAAYAAPSIAAPTGSSAAAKATTTVVVNPNNLQGWIRQSFDAVTNADLATTQTFVFGPATPPLGVGSLRMAIDAAAPNRVEQFRTARYDGKMLADLRDLAYSTFQRGTATPPDPQQPVYLRLNVDYTGDGVMDEQLYYIPANNGTVLQSTWQTWPAFAGRWGINGDDGPQNDQTLAEYLVEHPTAKLVNNGDGTASGGAVTFQVGASGANQLNGEYFLDRILIGFNAAGTTNTTVYNLEPLRPAPAFTWRISDAHATERDPGSFSRLTFWVTISKPMGKRVSVYYKTYNGTAIAGSDYTASTGQVTVPVGATRVRVSIPVLSDNRAEQVERMRVELSRPSAGAIADRVGVGTIVDDD